MYTIITGTVQKGAGRGKDLGYPTANIELDNKNIEHGVYVSRVIIQNANNKVEPKSKLPKTKQSHIIHSSKISSQEDWLDAVTFVGASETFGETDKKAETYILDFSGTIYGNKLQVQLLQKLRENIKFDSADKLLQQITQDIMQTKQYFGR